MFCLLPSLVYNNIMNNAYYIDGTNCNYRSSPVDEKRLKKPKIFEF